MTDHRLDAESGNSQLKMGDKFEAVVRQGPAKLMTRSRAVLWRR